MPGFQKIEDILTSPLDYLDKYWNENVIGNLDDEDDIQNALGETGYAIKWGGTNSNMTYPSPPLNILEIPPPELLDVTIYAPNLGGGDLMYEDDNPTPDTPMFDLSNGDVPLYNYLMDVNPPPNKGNVAQLYNFLPRFSLLTLAKPAALTALVYNAPYPTDEATGDTAQIDPETGEVTFGNLAYEQLPIEKYENQEQLIRSNLNNLVDESFFTSWTYSQFHYSSYHIQDNSIFTDTADLIKRCVQVQAEIKQVPIDDESIKEEVLKPYKDYDSIHGAAGQLQDLTNNVSKYAEEAYRGKVKGATVIFDPKTGDQYGQSTPFDRVVQYSQINSRYIGTIMDKMSSTVASNYMIEAAFDVPYAYELQEKVKAAADPSTISLDDYGLFIPDLSQKKLTLLKQKKFDEQADPNSLFEWNIRPIGYLIEKFEKKVLEQKGEGNTNNTVFWDRKDPVVFGTQDHLQGIDTKIKLNTVYMYRPRTVAIATVMITDSLTGVTSELQILVVSKPGASVTNKFSGDLKDPDSDAKVVDAVPPPLSDLKFVWDYATNELTIHWGYPAVKSQDVRYFKVYRRSSLFEPYQLLRLNDFNEKSLSIMSDNIRPSLVKKFLRNPDKQGELFKDGHVSTAVLGAVTRYTDAEFNKNSMYIYSIVVGDHNGQWSGYSPQYAVWFDMVTNKLKVQLVVPVGAPEPYPNWTLQTDLKDQLGATSLTTDSIKVSNYDQLLVAFTPDCRRVLDSESEPSADMKLLKVVRQENQTDGALELYERGIYYAVISNLDRHKTRVLRLELISK